MLIGQQLGPFAIDKELGSGAMGTVYLATYGKTGKRVAVKVMAPGLGRDNGLARFERESAILKQFNHPNIVRHFGSGKSQGTVYYAMEFLEGESLDHVMQRRGRITWEEVVTLGQQLCQGLQHAHEKGIIHRDLKPSNLMVMPDGTLKLTDFGIAKDMDVTVLTSANCTVGTAAYMSPEQCRGERDLTNKSDLYSMGVLFYELLVGRKPFLADNAMDMFLQHVQGSFERPARIVLDIPVWLDTVVCQLLEKKPEQRPYDAATVAQALNRVAEKVTAQRSAGLDAAKARAIDKMAGTLKADETDKEIARTLLKGTAKSKRKLRKKPFYQKVWFQASGIVVVLAGMALLLYLTFRPPSADSLFVQGKDLKNKGFDSYPEARETLNEFLRHYRKDPRAGEVTAMLNDMDADEKDQVLHRRINLVCNSGREFEQEDANEGLAYQAARREDFGDLAAARDRWQELKQKTADSGPWAALANRKLKQLEPKLPPPAEQAKARKELIQKKLDEAFELKVKGRKREAVRICDEIISLYADDPLYDEERKQARDLRKADDKPAKTEDKPDETKDKPDDKPKPP